jgi:hypothetical protein
MPRLPLAPKLTLFCALTFVLAACGVKPVPSSIPPPVVSPTVPVAAEHSCWNEWQQMRSVSAFDCASNEYRLAIEQHPTNAENHFRLGVLNWEGGQKELGREEIINAIRLDILNTNYIEYLFGQVIPAPMQVDINGNLPLYTEQFDTPYFTAQGGNVTRFDMTEVHAPTNVADGATAIQLEWKKPKGSWASLIVGFDAEIANREKALEGGLISLGGLNRSNLDEYTLTFWAKGEGIQGSEWPDEGMVDMFLRIKLQDQNLAIRESIGNQLVYDLSLTEKWKKYTIPLNVFRLDAWWIHDAVCPQEISYLDCDAAKLFDFDWSRVKQINFDVPYYSTNGTIYLDEIRIIHLD